ncbi:major capsid pentamer protein [Gordonia phage Mariokart]|nr:major capsid pentamer protein [Gordonia phage Mariokart]
MTTPVATPDLLSVVYDTPLVNPSPQGLYPAVTWVEDGGASAPRWLANGARFRVNNYGGEDSTGLWEAEWCGDPGDAIKDGERPEDPDAFDPYTAWAFDMCDPTSQSQAEVRTRAQQNLRLIEPVVIEREFGARALADAGAPTPFTTIIAAVGYLEAQLALTNTVGVIHAPAALAALAASENLIVRQGGALRTPLGHLWVFGGGYNVPLGQALVATSPVYGWRSDVVLRDTVEARYNQYVAVAERSVVVGYEKAIAAASITETP